MQWIKHLTVYNCVLTLMYELHSQEWQGTAKELCNALQPYAVAWSRGDIPINARSLSVALKHIEGILHSMAHIEVDHKRTGKQRTRLIIVRRLESADVRQPPFIHF